jgi:acyl-CoA thioesterase
MAVAARAKAKARNLAQDTAVTSLKAAPGWYTADLGPEWNFLTPSGGVLMTIAMRAMYEELGDDDLRPLSANTHFCSPVPAGPLEIRVEVLRHGRAAAQVRAQLSSTAVPGPGLEVSATFARRRPTRIEMLDSKFPDVAKPDALPTMESLTDISGRERPAFFDNLDSRLAIGEPWWEEGWKAGRARIARWYRYLTPQKLTDGRFDPLAIPPIADTMPPALIQKLGPEHPPFFAPSLDLTVHFLEDTWAEWLLTDVHARWAGFGYGSAAVEIWDLEGKLIAFGTQMMFLRSEPTERERQTK